MSATGKTPSDMWTRRRGLALILAVLFLVFGGRLFYIQGVLGPALAADAREHRTRNYVVQAPRGAIVDRTGKPLASSAERVNIGVNQQKVASFVHRVDKKVVGTGAEAAANLLTPILGPILKIDEAELGGRLIGDKTWVYLARDLLPSVWRQIRALGIPGIEPEWIATREYPNGSTAGNLVGFVKRDGQTVSGIAGLEMSLNDVLQGKAGAETVEIGAGGQVIPTGANEIKAAEPGSTIHLTIDRDLQFLAEKAVTEAAARYGAQWAAMSMIEIGTGRIIVMADSNPVDPNKPGASPPNSRGARSVSAPYEPGSTGKLLTIAAAIDQGRVQPSTVFTVPDQYTINGQTFKDPENHPVYRLTMAGILAVSSNVGTVMAGNLMDDSKRFEYMQNFGFGKKTTLGLPGEEAGILRPPKNWDGRTRMATMFGQGYAITLAQNVAMVATIGNGGKYVAPYLVESIEHPNGKITVPTRPESRQVISPNAAQQMLDMMEGVVQEGGTAPKARIAGYRVAGKTGTAQVPDAQGKLTQTVSNFVAVVPADKPRFAIAVVLYKPQSGFFGGTIAAPLFKELAEAALKAYGVPPSKGEPPRLPWTADGATKL